MGNVNSVQQAYLAANRFIPRGNYSLPIFEWEDDYTAAAEQSTVLCVTPPKGAKYAGGEIYNGALGAGTTLQVGVAAPAVPPVATGGITDGSTGVITGLASTVGFYVGMLVTVSAGFASTLQLIAAVGATTITVWNNSNLATTGTTVTGGANAPMFSGGTTISGASAAKTALTTTVPANANYIFDGATQVIITIAGANATGAITLRLKLAMPD